MLKIFQLSPNCPRISLNRLPNPWMIVPKMSLCIDFFATQDGIGLAGDMECQNHATISTVSGFTHVNPDAKLW